MKKKILAILLVAMMVVSILPVSALAEAAEEVEATCPGAGKTHSLTNCSDAVEKATVEGDCTAWGYTIYECPVCGDDFADDFVEPTKAHKVSNPTEEAVAATCTTPGKTAAGVCDVCGTEVKSQPIAALGHKKADDDKGTAAKTEDGKCGIAYKCVTCGETYVVEAEGDHVWGKTPVIVVEPGYYTWGEAEYTCTACSATKIVAIRPEHKCTKVTHVAAVPVSCEKDGNVEYWQCDECKTNYADADLTEKLDNVVIPALGHKFTGTNVAAGKGYTTSIAFNTSYPDSGKELTNGAFGKADPSDAAWVGYNGAVQITIDLGRVHDNLTEFSAEFLGGGWGINLPYGYGVYVSEDGVNWTVAASVDGVWEEINVSTFTTLTYTAKAATPVSARYVKFNVWNWGTFVFVSELSVKDSAPVVEKVDSTCIKKGSQVVECINGCGKTETQELPLAPHEYDPKPIYTVPATCEKYGFELYACTVCGDIKTVESLAPLGHTPYACSVHTDKADDKCEECAKAAKSYDKVMKAPTCLANGSLTWKCGICDKEQTAVLKATGHNEKTITVAATCHQYGFSYKVCTNDNCDGKHVKPSVGFGENGVIVYFEKDGVKYILPDLNFTCCFEFTVDEKGGLDPKNHTRDNSKSYYLVTPTCTTGGTDVFFCAYCDFYEVTDVDALGHDFTIGEDNATYTKATCTAAGFWTVNCAKGCTTTVKDKNNKDVTVPVSTVIVDEKAPALGHEYADATKVQPTVTNPTCEADGYKFYDCLRCSNNGKFDAACDKLVEKLDKLVNKAPVDGREEVFNSKAAAEAVHKITSWKVLRQGDCQLIGLEVAKCDLCDLDILAVIPDTGHHVAPDFAKESYALNVTHVNAKVYGDNANIVAIYSTDSSKTVNDICSDAGTWGCQVMLEQQADGTWKVTKVSAPGSTSHLSWTLGFDKVVLSAYTYYAGGGDSAMVGTMTVGSIWRSNLNALELAGVKTGDAFYFVAANNAAYPAVNDTCINSGYTAQYNCTLCRELVKSEVVKHTTDKVVDITAKDPTCTEDGCTEGWHCADCGYTVVSTTIKATGHEEWTLVIDGTQLNPTCTTFGFYYAQCNECGREELWNYHKALGHDFSVVKTPVGCLTDGTLGCSRCDATENVEAKGHEMTVKVDGKDTTVYFGFCDQTTPEKATCNKCDKPETTGHRQTSLNTVEVAPTCVEYGYYLTTCDDCEWFSMVKIEKLADHKIEWDAKKYVAPTFHAAGSKTGTCSVCKGEFTEEVKALEGLGYFVSLDNAVVSGAELVDSATLAVTINLDGNNADVWGVRFNVEYDKAVLKFDSFEFVCDEYNLLGEVNDNNGYVTVVANMSNKDATGVGNATINAETSFVVLYFTVSTNNTVVKESAVTVKPVEAINAEGKDVAVNYAGEAKFAVAAYLDANEDGAVNLADALYIYNIVSSGSGEYDASVDVDKDGVITLFDFIAVYKFLSGEFVYADMVNGGVKVEAPKA